MVVQGSDGEVQQSDAGRAEDSEQLLRDDASISKKTYKGRRVPLQEVVQAEAKVELRATVRVRVRDEIKEFRK